MPLLGYRNLLENSVQLDKGSIEILSLEIIEEWRQKSLRESRKYISFHSKNSENIERRTLNTNMYRISEWGCFPDESVRNPL